MTTLSVGLNKCKIISPEQEPRFEIPAGIPGKGWTVHCCDNSRQDEETSVRCK